MVNWNHPFFKKKKIITVVDLKSRKKKAFECEMAGLILTSDVPVMSLGPFLAMI